MIALFSVCVMDANSAYLGDTSLPKRDRVAPRSGLDHAFSSVVAHLRENGIIESKLLVTTLKILKFPKFGIEL
jgi:hypothetical protein